MKKIFKSKYSWFLLAIIVLAGIMRFYNYAGWSLSNDELSALNRIQFENVSEVINVGVKEMDTHPAGIQVFIYFWTKIFGNTEASYRFPFVVAGIISVLLVYMVVSKWFNKTSGIFAALILSFLSYPILYSQLARPYSFGLMFVLLSVWFWYLILFEPERAKFKHYALFSLSVTLSAYTHYFSFLFVIMVCVTGFIFLRKQNVIKYLAACGVSGILLLPHLKISFYQVTNGMNNIFWVPYPEKDWLLEYLNYAFNQSYILQIAVLLLIISFIVFYRKEIQWSKLSIIAFLWFLFPYLFGHLYSVYKTPLLQYSVLLFSFPFLIAFLMSVLPDKLDKFIFVKFLIIAVIGVYSTCIGQGFYSKQQFSVFKELAEKTAEWQKTYGDDNITRVVNVIEPYYINYYADRNDEPLMYNLYLEREREDLGRLMELVENSKTKYFEFSWSNGGNFIEYEEIIRTKYNKVVEKIDHFNSGIRLFTIDDSCQRNVIYRSILNFDQPNEDWTFHDFACDTVRYFSENASCFMDTSMEYSPFILEKRFEEINPTNDSCIINLSAMVFSMDTVKGKLALEVRRGDSIIYWRAAWLSQYDYKALWKRILVTRYTGQEEQSDIMVLEPNDLIRVFFWNYAKTSIYIDDIKLEVIKRE